MFILEKNTRVHMDTLSVKVYKLNEFFTNIKNKQK